MLSREIRRQTDQGMRNAREVIQDAYREFHQIFGRQGGNPFVEEYMTEGADVLLVGQGTLAMPAKVTVRKLREQGKKVGFVRLKWLRPFPTEEIQQVLGRAKAVGVLNVGWREPHDLASARLDLLQAMGGPFAAAVEAQRLLADLRAAAPHLQRPEPPEEDG